MRIGIEAQRIFREQKHGMDFVALELIRALQRLDHENDYFIFVMDGPDDGVLQPSENLKVIHLGGSFPLNEQFWIPMQVRKLKLDLVHFTSNTAPISPGAPVVLTLHDLIFKENKALFSGGYSLYQAFGNLYRKLLLPFYLRNVRHLITVSHFEEENIRQHFPRIKASEISVIYNGFAQHFKLIEDEEYLTKVAKRYQLPSKFLLFLGNTDPKKNSPRVIQAFAQLCAEKSLDCKLVVADLADEVIKDYLHEVRLEDQFSNFHSTNYIRNEDLPAIMNQATLFLYPSLRESFGIPLLEAMACACPVITGNNSCLPEIAQDAAFKVDAKDTQALKEAIDLVLNNAQLRQDLKERGLHRCQDFSWDVNARKTLDLYKQLIY